MKKILLSVGLIFAGLILSFFNERTALPVIATQEWTCGTTKTYEENNDEDNSVYKVDFKNNDTRIDVSAKNGYKIVKVWLDVSDDNQNGYVHVSSGPLNNYNPNGDEINKVKLEVEKVCDYQLNLSHIECTEQGVEVHFVLLHVPDGITPGSLTYTYGSIPVGKHTGNAWHYTDYLVDGTYNVQTASVQVNGTTVNLHNPGAYTGEYNCNPPIDICANIDDLQEVLPANYYLVDDNQCLPKTPVCGDDSYDNYDNNVSETEYVDNAVCENEPEVCEDQAALNYGQEGECEYPEDPEVCEDESASNYDQEEECEYPTPTPTPTTTGTPDKEYSKISVDHLRCGEYDFRAEMTLRTGDKPLQDVLVTFTYNGMSKNDYTNEDGKARVTFDFTGEAVVKATPNNGFDSQETKVTQETNCQEMGAGMRSEGQVLGANTYAQAGVFEDIMMSIMGLSGATMTAVGAKLHAKKKN